MSAKFVSCTLGQIYRKVNEDGSISGGPMYYLRNGLGDIDKDGWIINKNGYPAIGKLLGIMYAIHGDDKGLVIPPKMAPNKVVIVPILFKDTKAKVLKKAKELKKKIGKYDVLLDEREDYSPGWKFNEWELKGVPVRMEIGPRD